MRIATWNVNSVKARLPRLVSWLADRQPDFDGVLEDRAIGATCAGIRLWSLYAPNGRQVGHPHFDYKLRFLDAVRAQAAAERAVLGTEAPYGLLGDFNVAPLDDDVWDIAAFTGSTHVSAPERNAVTAIGQASCGVLIQQCDYLGSGSKPCDLGARVVDVSLFRARGARAA